MAKKTKHITEEVKQQYKAFFEGEKGVFIIGKLSRDVTENCKLRKAIEFTIKLGYNHDDIIMIHEETSMAEKIKNFSLTKVFY